MPALAGAMARHKHLIGPKLQARSLPGQKGEVAIAVAVLSGMLRTAKLSQPNAGPCITLSRSMPRHMGSRM